MKHLFMLPVSPWDQQPSSGGRSYVPSSFSTCPVKATWFCGLSSTFKKHLPFGCSSQNMYTSQVGKLS